MTAYYNEHDPKAAAWLRELIKAGLIAPGVVDERSIVDVNPYELTQYNQHHFFAGIGGWSYALRLAGWPDYRRIVTGSCPCQPYSAAGLGLGTADERHLWPVFYNIITFLGVPDVVGEQVASKAALEWLDGVFADLEGSGYACGAADLCAASVGADHIRQRIFWMAHANGRKCNGLAGGQGRKPNRAPARRQQGNGKFECDSPISRLGNADSAGSFSRRQAAKADGHGSTTLTDGSTGRLEHTASDGRFERWTESERRRTGRRCWDVYETIACADGKTRRFEPGSFPLAHGVSGRVGLLRGYGNAIVPQVAAEFIQAAAEAIN